MTRMFRPGSAGRHSFPAPPRQLVGLNDFQRETVDLAPEERIVAVLRRSIVDALVTAAKIISAVLVVSAPLAYLEGPSVILLALPLAGAGVALTLFDWMRRIYVITSDRVIEISGVFVLSSHELRITDILTVVTQRDLLGGLFDYGTIMISTAATVGAAITLRNVWTPQALRGQLESIRLSISERDDFRSPNV